MPICLRPKKTTIYMTVLNKKNREDKTKDENGAQLTWRLFMALALASSQLSFPLHARCCQSAWDMGSLGACQRIANMT
jgi:hypothetical protein